MFFHENLFKIGPNYKGVTIVCLEKQCNSEKNEKKKIHIKRQNFNVYEQIGENIDASVYHTFYILDYKNVAIKIFDFKRLYSERVSIFFIVQDFYNYKIII